MKTKVMYENVEIEVIEFEVGDVITTSSDSDPDDAGYEEEFDEE